MEEKKRVKYEFMHLGINCDAEPEAQKTADALSGLFNLEPHMGKKSLFAGDLFECVKVPQAAGKNGHIGMYADDLQAAIAELTEKGFAVDEARMMRDADGNVYNVFLKDEIGGFAIHIRQK